MVESPYVAVDIKKSFSVIPLKILFGSLSIIVHFFNSFPADVGFCQSVHIYTDWNLLLSLSCSRYCIKQHLISLAFPYILKWLKYTLNENSGISEVWILLCSAHKFVCESVLEKTDPVWFEIHVKQGLYLTDIVQTWIHIKNSSANFHENLFTGT